MTTQYVWRFGYGSNIGLTTLQQKKNLNPSKYLAGTIKGWELYFVPGIRHVEPGWAAVRRCPLPMTDTTTTTTTTTTNDDEEETKLHGSAFLIPKDEADGLDKQEAGYNVLPCQFVSYDGEVVEDVGLYVPKERKKTDDAATKKEEEEGIPSLRYLRLLQNGAREAPLSDEWIKQLDSFEYYITPPEIRSQTTKWISEFDTDVERKDVIWTAEQLSKYDGSSAEFPAHTSVMEYIVELGSDVWVFPSWKGHNVTRRNLLQFNGKSLDSGDIRYGQDGFRPLPKLSECSDEEKEYLFQNLESVLQRGGRIVGRLKDFLDDQEVGGVGEILN